MIQPDLIVSWPKNNDYPLWREMLRSNRHRFNSVLVVFTETNDGVDYSPWVKLAMANDGVTFIQQPPVVGDWRNIAVNEALRQSSSEWVFFTEQDFFYRPDFWKYIEGNIGQVDVIAVMDSERMHPCCMFMSRDAVNKTCRDFGVIPGVSDHFSMIHNDIKEKGMSVEVIPSNMYRHMNGLSHNFKLLDSGEEPNYKPEEFKQYLMACLMVDVPLNEEWVQLVYPYVNPE